MTDDASILLVEDNEMDADLTMRAFRRRHVTNPVDLVRDGEEALARIERWDTGERRPAIILLDLKLPKVDGLEVLRRLKRHPVHCTIPIIVLTTSAQDADVQAAYRLGANSYIVKPVDFEAFMGVAAQIDVYWTLLNKRPSDRHAHPLRRRRCGRRRPGPGRVPALGPRLEPRGRADAG